MSLRRFMMTLANALLLCLAMPGALLAALVGYLQQAPSSLIALEIGGPILLLFLIGPVIAVIYALVTWLGRGSQRWKIALRLITLLCLVGLLTWVQSTGGTFWWLGLPVVVGLTPPLLVAGAYSPTGEWRPWLIQLGCLCLSVLVAFGAGRLSHLALLPQNPFLLVQDERRATDKDEQPQCPDPTGAKEAVLATGLVSGVAASAPLPKRPDEVPVNRECERPLLIGQRAGGEPIAFWLAFVAGGDKGRWVISGSTPLGGPRGREAGLAAVAAAKSGEVLYVDLVGPLRPYWRLQTAAKTYAYRLDRVALEPDQPCDGLDEAIVTKIKSVVPGFLSPGFHCTDDPEHPGRMLVESIFSGVPAVWIEDGKVAGQIMQSMVPSDSTTIKAIKAAGYLLVPFSLGDRWRRPVGGSEHPAWEVEAWELPSYRRVLLHQDWETGKVIRSGP